jgi:hypothetical protein
MYPKEADDPRRLALGKPPMALVVGATAGGTAGAPAVVRTIR